MDSRDAHIEDTREPADTVEYSEVVKSFLDDLEVEIDQLLEMCADLNFAGDCVGIADFRDAADRVCDLVSVVYVGFKRTDRLAVVRKQNQRERQSL